VEDPQCSNCHIPLRAVIRHKNNRCFDEVACNARRKLLLNGNVGYIVNPNGVTRFEIIKGG
jgi:hypothetical protein